MSADRSALTKILEESLHLTLPPVGIALCDSVPAGVPLRQVQAPAGCVFWQDATREVFATTAKDHEACAIGTYTHNLATTPAHEQDRADALQVFADLDYLPPAELARIPVLNKRPSSIVYGPLAQMPLAPDVVLLFVRANQQLIIAEAASSVDGGTPPAMGRPACAIVPHAVGSQQAALSLGCCGARAYVDALGDDIALFALPGPRLERYVTRIAELVRANATLSQFHQLRRRDVADGTVPTIRESLARLNASR